MSKKQSIWILFWVGVAIVLWTAAMATMAVATSGGEWFPIFTWLLTCFTVVILSILGFFVALSLIVNVYKRLA